MSEFAKINLMNLLHALQIFKALYSQPVLSNLCEWRIFHLVPAVAGEEARSATCETGVRVPRLQGMEEASTSRIERRAAAGKFAGLRAIPRSAQSFSSLAAQVLAHFRKHLTILFGPNISPRHFQQIDGSYTSKEPWANSFHEIRRAHPRISLPFKPYFFTYLRGPPISRHSQFSLSKFTENSPYRQPLTTSHRSHRRVKQPFAEPSLCHRRGLARTTAEHPIKSPSSSPNLHQICPLGHSWNYSPF
ncbi:amidase [Striga asiatica]|uniref:Amidase n=1 Tax=Striga asiatica TaxID=4170 RepID=A0A5A7PM18_STRAF|nr:amidase [Striga asiatica]